MGKNLPTNNYTDQIIQLIADGYSNQQISDDLGIQISEITTLIKKPEVQLAITKLSTEVMATFGSSKSQIKAMMRRVILSDLTDFYVDGGKDAGQMKPFSQIPLALRQCITELQFVHTQDSMGMPVVNTKIKTISKDKAVEILARLDGLFSETPDKGGMIFDIGYE